jgi:uncharacterized protein (DUF924 family)
MAAPATPQDVISFWRAAGRDKWFGKDDAFDRAIRDGFLSTYEAAAAGELRDWERTPEGALALVIALDQFPRNMFRGEARSYAADPLARAVSARARAQGFDRKVEPALRSFFYLPLMHSERAEDQSECVALFKELSDENGLRFAELHAALIRQFGRFPHRNTALGRDTTAEERAYLDAGGFAG